MSQSCPTDWTDCEGKEEKFTVKICAEAGEDVVQFRAYFNTFMGGIPSIAHIVQHKTSHSTMVHSELYLHELCILLKDINF